MIKSSGSKFKSSSTHLLIALLVVAVLVSGLLALRFYRGSSSLGRVEAATANLPSSASSSVEALLAEVSQLIVLPTGEVPTVATVADPDKLKSQAFFAQAQTGDRVLIYPQARQAILYRPSEKKLIAVGPFVATATSTRP